MTTELRGIPCIPKIQISHMWQMNKEVGFVLTVTDLLMHEVSDSCPWQDEETHSFLP